MNRKNKILSYTVSYVIAALIAFLVYYVTLPAINLQSKGFYVYLTFVIGLICAPIWIFGQEKGFLSQILEEMANGSKRKKKKGDFVFPKKSKKSAIMLAIICIPIVILLVGSLISSTVFNARAFSEIITVSEEKFEDDMPKTEKVTNIALMDTDTAKIIGNRTLGSLSDVVSQFEISQNYNQINYMRTPKKVANLEYAGFFKWMGNKSTGIPGYVMVDPVNNTAEYKELTKPLKYVDSGYFGDDLMRKLRFSYPTKILGDPRFEIDDSGNPVFIVPCYKPQVLLFGAEDVNEVIIFDPCTGDSEIYDLEKTPAWIDVVYDGYLACEKYDWKGIYSGGFINSIIGNKDCVQTTDDFGYVILGDDVWYYTGVTSVNSDKSNIGFILSNARTGEYKFYPVIGAEEHSAMTAAEGEVQEKGYVASFPVLINVEGEATYIMVLKDAGGLVKLYALVNVEQYSVVATATTQTEAMNAYKALLYENGIIDKPSDDPTIDTTTISMLIEKISIVTHNGESYIYFNGSFGSNDIVLRKIIFEDEELLFINENDKVKFVVIKTETKNVYEIISWEILQKFDIDQTIETIISEKAEEIVNQKANEKVEEKANEVIDKLAQEKVEEKAEEIVESKAEEKINQKVEEKAEEIVDKKTRESLEKILIEYGFMDKKITISYENNELKRFSQSLIYAYPTFTQGMCLSYEYLFVSSSPSNNADPNDYLIYKIDLLSREIVAISSTSFNHANGMTYNQKTNKLYICAADGRSSTETSVSDMDYSLYVVNADTLSLEKVIDLKSIILSVYDESLGVCGIAYNPDYDEYYLLTRYPERHIITLNSDFTFKNSFYLFDAYSIGGVVGDICTDGEKIYVPTWRSDINNLNNEVRVYDRSGNYLGIYNVDGYTHIESMDIREDEYYYSFIDFNDPQLHAKVFKTRNFSDKN